MSQSHSLVTVAKPDDISSSEDDAPSFQGKIIYKPLDGSIPLTFQEWTLRKILAVGLSCDFYHNGKIAMTLPEFSSAIFLMALFKI